MGNFTEHIQKSKNNIVFLEKINNGVDNCWDWQVTTCFYSALHLINAHIISKTNKNYLSHNQVSDAINPYNQLSVAKLDEETFLSYNKLMQLSRRSRYLLNENFDKKGVVDVQPACLTYDKHFKKCVYHLDKIITFIKKTYNEEFDKKTLICVEFKGIEYDNFITKEK